MLWLTNMRMGLFLCFHLPLLQDLGNFNFNLSNLGRFDYIHTYYYKLFKAKISGCLVIIGMITVVSILKAIKILTQVISKNCIQFTSHSI